MQTIKLVTCTTCFGRKKVVRSLSTPQGRMELNVPCTPCGGSGKVVKVRG